MCEQVFRGVFEQVFLVMINQAEPPTQPQTSGANGDHGESKIHKYHVPI